jgi:histidinol-phosphate aminotransferase
MSILRADLSDLPRYSSARLEFTGNVEISLDANENPFVTVAGLNRYPDGQYRALKRALCTECGLCEENIFLGSGSDECIDVLLKATTLPGKGSIVVFPPTYSMYEVQAKILGLTCITWKREQDFSIDVDRFIGANISANVIFICSPNNPTGNTTSVERIKKLLAGFPKTLIVIDEAYIEFSDYGSLSSLISEYPNIAILRTLSKAVGLAGLRVGYLLAGKEIIEACNKVKLPYNLSSVTEKIARRYLKNRGKIREQIAIINSQRKLLTEKLSENKLVKKVFPSEGNFLLVLVEDAKVCRSELLKKGIVVRDRSSDYLCEECIRITIGTPYENMKLLEAWNEIAEKYSNREKISLVPKTKIDIQRTRRTVLFNAAVLFSPEQNEGGMYLLNSGVLKSLFLLGDEQKFRLLIALDGSKSEQRDEQEVTPESYSASARTILSLLTSQGINISSIDSRDMPIDSDRLLVISQEKSTGVSEDSSKESINSSQTISVSIQNGECLYKAESLYEALFFVSKNTPDLSISRKTKETEITCTLNLWGNGEVQIKTGIGFFDHMLSQTGFYGKLRLKIAAFGDLDIDEHHTIEDVALVLGAAFDKCLGDRSGIRRYGFSVPMDEAICSCVVDLSGRSELVWNASFKRERIGDMPTEMIKHFFKSFTNTAKVNLHISASGENEHHIAESIFKAFGQSLRGALRLDPLAMIPSTKGVL